MSSAIHGRTTSITYLTPKSAICLIRTCRSGRHSHEGMNYSTQFLDVSVRTFSLAYLGKLVSRSKVPEAWVLVSVKSRSLASTPPPSMTIPLITFQLLASWVQLVVWIFDRSDVISRNLFWRWLKTFARLRVLFQSTCEICKQQNTQNTSKEVQEVQEGDNGDD